MPTAERRRYDADRVTVAESIASHPQMNARAVQLVDRLRADITYAMRTGTDPTPIARVALGDLLADRAPSDDTDREQQEQYEALRPWIDAMGPAASDADADPDGQAEAASGSPAHLVALLNDIEGALRHGTQPSAVARSTLPALVRALDSREQRAHAQRVAGQFDAVRRFARHFRHLHGKPDRNDTGQNSTTNAN